MKKAAILIIGNEVLNGSTLDTNSNWICKQVVGRGAYVDRISIVHDDPDEVGAELHRMLAIKPDLIVTVGGLGPTRDDLTLRAIAKAANREVHQNDEALRIVHERYAVLEKDGVVGPALSESSKKARGKMAVIPDGAKPLYNPVGAAPAVYFSVQNTIVLSLPGVPAEVKSIILHHAAPVMEEALGTGYFRTLTLMTSTNDESRLSAPSATLQDEFPNVYVKTRPIKAKSGLIGITLSRGGAVLDELTKELQAAERQLESLLASDDIKVLSVEEDE